jgi:tetratricopeptide (TPR) repeat protein
MSSAIFWSILIVIIGSLLAVGIFLFQRRSRAASKPTATGPVPQDPSFLKKAQAAKEKGQYAEAGEIYERLGLLPDAIGMYKKAGLYHHTARLYERHRQWGEAAAMYELNQNYEKAARCYQQSYNFVKAAQLFQTLGKRRLAAEMYERGKCFLDAARLYEQEEQPQKAGEMYLALKEYGLAAQQFEGCYHQMKKGDLSPEEKVFLADYARRSGDLYFQANNLQAAAKIYAEADLAAEAAAAYLRLGNVSKANEFAERLSDPTEVIKIYDKNGQLTKGLEVAAAIHLRENRPLEAAKLWERAGNLRAAAEALEQVQRFKEAAQLYEQLKETQKAVSLLEKAGEFYKAALLHQRLGQLDETFRLLERITPDSPLWAEAWLMMGRIRLQQGRLDEARDVYRKLVSALPTSPMDLTPYYELALVTERLGDTKEAIALYARVLQSDPHYRDAKFRHDRLLEPQATERPAHEIGRAESEDIPTPVLSSRYRLLRMIGQGGCGTVHEALDVVLNRTVAVKLLSESTGDNLGRIEDFIREARTAAILNHPNIVTIHDTGQSGPKYFIVMEYVEGESLKDLLEDRTTLPLSQILNLVKQACLGLDYAHRKGILHRDIKPGNILVDREGIVKITDFGLARFSTETSPETVVRGTPFYMSPEQIRGLKTDPRSDIYSLGCTLYRMVAKRPPFTKGDIYQQHLKSQPPPPSTINPEIPEALNRLILKCLEKEMNQRYPDVASLLRDLEKVS